MNAVVNQIIDSISGTVPRSENEYKGKDGLLHCLICHRAVEVEVEALGKKKKVRCICDCRKKELDARLERDRIDEIERQRKVCFIESNMHKWTFENDDRQNAKLSDAMKNYVENFREFKKEGTGLLLYGTVGIGKTYYAACIANSLIDKGVSVLMTNFISLANQLFNAKDKQLFVENLNKYSLLIIDDLGAERKSEFMQEQVWNIIDSLYRSGLPFIVTTNLTAEELKKSNDITYSRIYDRILERCFPVEVAGASRRRQNLRDSFGDTKSRLGL